MSFKALVKGLILIGSLVLIGFVVKSTDVGSLFDKAWIDADIKGKGIAGEFLFYAAAALFTAVGLPRHVISFLSGYAFGFVAGTALALAATLTGCVIAFTYSRFLGRSLVSRHFPGKVRAIDDFLHDNPLQMTLLVRFLPVGSNLATNLAAGVSSVPAVPFFAGSGVGYIPQTLIFALVGSGVAVDPVFRIGVGGVLFVVSSLLGVHLYRQYRHGKHLDAEVEEQIGGGD